LHIQRPLYLDRARPRLAHLSLLSGVAGLFRDDSLVVDVTAAAGAAAAIGTPAMTRVFAMPDGEAQMAISVRVERGGYLEYLPEPTLLCADAALTQQLVIDVAAGGCLVAADLLAFGREAAGERHAFRRCDQRTDVSVDGRLVLAERLALARSDTGEACSRDPLLDFAAYGALHVVCNCEPASELLSRLSAVLKTMPVYAGASLTSGNRSVAVRVLGSSASQVRDAAACLARAVRDRHAFGAGRRS
jgi:urease accessory protein